MKHRLVPVALLTLVLAACSGATEPDLVEAPTTTVTTSVPQSTATQPPPADLGTSTTATTSTTSSTLAGDTPLADLTEYQQELVSEICLWAADPTSFDGDTISMYFSVVDGDAGVPALAEAWEAIGQEGSVSELRAAYLAAALPICSDLGWTQRS